MTALDIRSVNGRRETWLLISGVGGWVCAEPDPGRPDGICGMPVESECCPVHHPEANEEPA